MKRSFLTLAGALALAGSAVAQTVPAPMAPAGAAFVAPAQSPTQWLASKAIGMNVYNSANEKVGDINDVVLDGATVNAVVIGVGGFLGMGEKNVAVAPQAIHMMRDANGAVKLTIDASKDQLKAAPAYQFMAAKT